MRRWDPLNDRQLMLLRRVAADVEPVTSREPASARTVYALRDRGLVTTPRRDGVWTAGITDKGRFYLERGHHPDRPRRRPARRRPPVSKRDEPAAHITPGELLERLTPDGIVRLVNLSDEERAAWRRAIHAVKRQGGVPAGYHLRHRGRDRGELVIELLEGEHPDARHRKAPPPSVVALSEVDDAHPVLRRLRGDPDLVEVSHGMRPRALLIAQALVSEAVRRGHIAAVHAGSAGLWIEIGEHAYQVRIRERWAEVDELPSEAELNQQRTYAWQRVQPRRASRPTGELTVEVAGDGGCSPKRWRDTRRWRVEAKLGEVLREIESRAQRDETTRVAEAEAKARRRREWEQAMGQARERLREDHRVAALEQQVKQWSNAERIRRYCHALQTALTKDGLMDEETSEWVAWARGHADRIDPVTNGSSPVPEDPEINVWDLKPYLGRWSPYGPDRS